MTIQNPMLAARRVTEDPAVSDLEKHAKDFKRDWTSTAWTIPAAALFIAFVLTVLIPHSKGLFFVITVPFCILNLAVSGGRESQDFYDKRAVRGRIRKARRIAKRVNSNAPAILTKEFIEARQRVEDAMYTGFRSVINKTEREAIFALLFENVDREKAIISLIEDRHMSTAKEIGAVLKDMEANSAAPLQDGWL